MNAQRTPFLADYLAPRWDLWYADAVSWDGQHVVLDIAYRDRAHRLLLVAPHREEGDEPNRRFSPWSPWSVSWAFPRHGARIATHVCVTLRVFVETDGYSAERAMYVGAWRVLNDLGDVLSGVIPPAVPLERFPNGEIERWTRYPAPDVEESYLRSADYLGSAYDEATSTLHAFRQLYEYYRVCNGPFFGRCRTSYHRKTTKLVYHTRPGTDEALLEDTTENNCWIDFSQPDFPEVCDPDRDVRITSPNYPRLGVDPQHCGHVLGCLVETKLTDPFHTLRSERYLLRSDRLRVQLDFEGTCNPGASSGVSAWGGDILFTLQGSYYDMRENPETYRHLRLRVYRYASGQLADLSDTRTDLARGLGQARYVWWTAPITHAEWCAIFFDNPDLKHYSVVRLRSGIRNIALERMVEKAYRLVPVRRWGDNGPPVPGAWQAVRR